MLGHPSRAHVRRGSLFSALLALVAGLLAFGLPTPANASATPYTTLMISEVYGGDGSANATYHHDFVELFNPTSQPIAIAPLPATEAVSPMFSARRPEHTTVNPAAAKAMLEARPMPLPAPVTSATGLIAQRRESDRRARHRCRSG